MMYLASFGVEFCSFLLLYRPPVTVAINNSQPLVYTFMPSFISNISFQKVSM